MKKNIYIAPAIVSIRIDADTKILAGSLETSQSESESTSDPGFGKETGADGYQEWE